MTELVQTSVRPLNMLDALKVAELCFQLGYSVSQEAVQQYLQQIRLDERHRAYAAVLLSGQLVGWVHIYTCQLVMTNLQAEIGGLIVDKDYRRYGIGRLLMQHAEQWARNKGCQTVVLRSNLTRKEAHLFYRRAGYSNLKTSLVFHKVL